ncbi:MAG: DUF4417 domain-containing protein [Lachnospirales bacterium]
MLKGLTEEEQYKAIRPIIGEYDEDEQHLPIINKTSIENTNWTKIEPLNFKNMVIGQSNHNKMTLMFAYDKDLYRFWNNPLKYVPQLTNASFIATPDYSAYSSMNCNEIRHDVYKTDGLERHGRIMVGNMIPSMTGKFISYKYTDTFSHKNKYEQLSFIEIQPIFEIKEAM